MPVKLGAKLPAESAEARIEIIPLIDIMFFLLAAFMLVSLSMVNLKAVKVNLPTAASATNDIKKDLVDVSVDGNGSVFLDKKRVGDYELMRSLSDLQKANPKLRVLISGDKDAKHGRMIQVLDAVRNAGIDKVAFEISPPSAGGEIMKVLGFINLSGVAILAVLCAIQWNANRRLNLLTIDLDKTRREQAQKIAEQESAIDGSKGDLSDFKDRLDRSEETLKKAEANLASMTAERDRVAEELSRATTERDEARKALDPWMAAVKQRDEALEKAADEVAGLLKDRDTAVAKFNDLAVKYNSLVKDLDDARAKLAAKH